MINRFVAAQRMPACVNTHTVRLFLAGHRRGGDGVVAVIAHRPSSLGHAAARQRNLEGANVEVVSEISDLIAAQRAYEMNAKVVSAADQMMQSTTGMFRRGRE